MTEVSLSRPSWKQDFKTFFFNSVQCLRWKFRGFYSDGNTFKLLKIDMFNSEMYRGYI